MLEGLVLVAEPLLSQSTATSLNGYLTCFGHLLVSIAQLAALDLFISRENDVAGGLVLETRACNTLHAIIVVNILRLDAGNQRVILSASIRKCLLRLLNFGLVHKSMLNEHLVARRRACDDWHRSPYTLTGHDTRLNRLIMSRPPLKFGLPN